MKKIHLIGIGGTGLSAIARILLERKYQVSGSDRQSNLLTNELADLGARIFIGHDPENIHNADMILRSSAINENNPEVQAAIRAGIPVLNRSEFLPILLKNDQVIAVAGTHGKTTTTAMLAWTLKTLGEDPSYIIGSISLNLGTNAHSGQGRFFVIEADEYDYMFLGLEPYIAVITMIEHDHPDFFPTQESFYTAFRQFAGQIKENGALIGCSDDVGSKKLMEQFANSPLTIKSYGLNAPASCSAQMLEIENGTGYRFRFYNQDQNLAEVDLHVPGLHNVQNALGVLAVIDFLGLPINRAAGALSSFQGTARRFQVVGEINGITIVDDYAHHPTEIRATLEAARQHYPGRKIWAIWQPHTFSRTRQMLFEFVKSFSEADRVIITDIYPARETLPSDGFSSVDVFNTMHHPNVEYIPELKDTAE